MHWQYVQQSKQRGASKAEEFVLIRGRFESLWDKKKKHSCYSNLQGDTGHSLDMQKNSERKYSQLIDG